MLVSGTLYAPRHCGLGEKSNVTRFRKTKMKAPISGLTPGGSCREYTSPTTTTTLHIKVGNHLAGFIEVPDGVTSVQFCNAEGVGVFEVRSSGPDKIEIRGINSHAVDGKMMSEQLRIVPKVSNSIVVENVPHTNISGPPDYGSVRSPKKKRDR